ncbi:hypothetical protein JCM3774_001765 [Rhodotorula dairenensis]
MKGAYSGETVDFSSRQRFYRHKLKKPVKTYKKLVAAGARPEEILKQIKDDFCFFARFCLGNPADPRTTTVETPSLPQIDTYWHGNVPPLWWSVFPLHTILKTMNGLISGSWGSTAAQFREWRTEMAAAQFNIPIEASAALPEDTREASATLKGRVAESVVGGKAFSGTIRFNTNGVRVSSSQKPSDNSPISVSATAPYTVNDAGGGIVISRLLEQLTVGRKARGQAKKGKGGANIFLDFVQTASEEGASPDFVTRMDKIRAENVKGLRKLAGPEGATGGRRRACDGPGGQGQWAGRQRVGNELVTGPADKDDGEEDSEWSDNEEA